MTRVAEPLLDKAPALQVHTVPGGYIVHQKVLGRVHQLNATASLLFELCNGTRTADEVVALARTGLGVPAREAGAIRKGLDELLRVGLVGARVAAPQSPARARAAAAKRAPKSAKVTSAKKATPGKASPRRRAS